MTTNELTDLMRRESEELDPASGQRILDQALTRGARRRRARHGAVGLAVAAVAAGAVGIGVALPGGTTGVSPATAGASDPAPTEPTVAPTPSAPPTYSPGSETEVPGGPVVETDRRVVGDARLAAVARDLLPDGVVGDLEVSHVETSDPSHIADRTREGRDVSFTFDGAGASARIQRWDGYAAVGVDLSGIEDLPAALDAELEQLVVTTARDACRGLQHTSRAADCRPTQGGWYSVSRPYQGDAMPSTYEELLVSYYTDDGYVVRIDSYNTSAEKSGTLVGDEPVLTVEESLAMATSEDWFGPR